jgi:hypothetical protein
VKVTVHQWLLTILFTAALGASAQENYFPEKAFGQGSQHWATLYSNQSRALREPSLYGLSKSASTQSYRFLWMRSFHELVSVRFDLESDGKATITIKKTSGSGGDAPGHLVGNRTRRLTLQQSEWFLEQVNQSGFWKLASHNDPEDDGGADGARWVIEGVKNGEYHAVDRWSPQSGPVRTLGLALAIELGHLKLSAKEIY